MSFRKELYDRTIHHKEFGKVKNKIYDILGWIVDYSISSVIAIEHPIGKGFFENVADTHDYYEGFNDAAQLIMATLKVVNWIKQQIENLE